MESAAAELAVILGALYLLDCFRWVSRSARLVRRLAPFSAHLEAPLRIAPQFPRSLAFGAPFPWERLVVAEGSCWRPLAEGLWLAGEELSTWARPGQGAAVVPWAEVARLEVRGLELWGPTRRLHVFGSRRAAATAGVELARLQAATSEVGRRQAAEAAAASRFDLAALEARWGVWRKHEGWLKGATTTLAASMVAVVLAMLQPEGAWWRLLPLLLVAWLAAMVAASLVIRRVLPSEVRPSRAQWVVLVLSPLSLARAADLVESELVADFEPVAVAAALLGQAEAERLLGAAVRALVYPLERGDGPHLDDAAARARYEQLVRGVAKAKGLRIDVAPPQGRHCPRCLTEYQAGVEGCSSCAGVRLVG